MTEHLDLDDLLLMVERGGLGPVRDLGLQVAAVARTRASAFGEDAYPTVWLKAAALLDSVTNHHALVDGNNRLGLLAVTVFLHLNGYGLGGEQEEAADLVLAVASGTSVDLAALADRIEASSESST